MSKRNILLLILLAIIALVAYLAWQVRMLAKAKWTPAGYWINSINLDKISLLLYYNIDNKGDISLTVADQDYEIYINGMFVSRVSNPIDTTIYANAVSKLPFLIEVKTDDLIRAGINNISALFNKAEREKMKIKIKGIITLKFGLITVKKMSFEQESTLAEMKESAAKNK